MDIKELLPAFVAEGLSGEDLARVQDHLRACADCTREEAVLRVMAHEPIPDPGEAFWTAMPARVYQAVQREKSAKQPARGSRWRLELSRHAVFFRWASAAAAACLVLLVSWFVTVPLLHREAGPDDESVYVDAANVEVMRHASLTIDELAEPELDAVDAWAASGLASLASELGPAAENAFDTDLAEELAELKGPEADRLSTMLNELNEEG